MTLSDLITKLESATGPDRELDRLIHFHVVSPWLAKTCTEWIPAAFEGPNDFLWWTAERKALGKEGYHDCWESVTASVDDAFEFLSEKLPGWRIRTEHGDNYSFVELVRGWGARKEVLGLATTERPDNHIAIAIMTTAIRALRAKEDGQ